MASPTSRNDSNKGRPSRLKVVHESDREHDMEHDDPGMGHMGGGSKKAEEGEGPWLVSYADLMTLLMGFFALMASMGKPDVQKIEKMQESTAKQFGGEFKKPYQELADKINEIIKKNKLEKQVKVSRAADGVTVKFDGTLFFNSGEIIVKEEGKKVIDTVLAPLEKEVPKYKAQLEGHTDNVPISHPIIASNWELSGIRAARIAALFEGHGFKKDQLIIMGWGETKPEVPNTTADGVPIPANQAKNRRVLLKIFNADSEGGLKAAEIDTAQVPPEPAETATAQATPPADVMPATATPASVATTAAAPAQQAPATQAQPARAPAQIPAVRPPDSPAK